MTEDLWNKICEKADQFPTTPEEIGTDKGFILEFETIPVNKIQAFADFLTIPEFAGMEWSEGKTRTYWKD